MLVKGILLSKCTVQQQKKKEEFYQVRFCSIKLYVWSFAPEYRAYRAKCLFSDQAADWTTEESWFDSCQGNKAAMYEVNISNPSSAEIENERSFVSTVPCALHGMGWVKFSFTLLYVSPMMHLFPATALQAGRLWFRFPRESFEFFIDFILPGALCPWGQINLLQE